MIGEIILLIAAIIFFITIVILGWGINTYNFFQSAKQDVENQWSNIKTEYQRRYDLFLNLAEAVKSYKKHENKTLTDVIKARSMLNFSGSNAKINKNMNMLDSFFSKLNVVFEKYPELKANEQHNSLMNEIRVSEERVNIARTSFNDLVNEYNTSVVTFPANIVAKMFKFDKVDYYINETVSDKAPKINLE